MISWHRGGRSRTTMKTCWEAETAPGSLQAIASGSAGCHVPCASGCPNNLRPGGCGGAVLVRLLQGACLHGSPSASRTTATTVNMSKHSLSQQGSAGNWEVGEPTGLQDQNTANYQWFKLHKGQICHGQLGPCHCVFVASVCHCWYIPAYPST